MKSSYHKLIFIIYILLLELSNNIHAQQINRGENLIDVLVVGNAVDGTVDFIDVESLTVRGTINVTPDLWWRILTMPINGLGWGFNLLREGGQRVLDDVVVTKDGRTLIASRGWMGDVVAFDLSDPHTPMIWRYDLPGLRADHMDISPDGSQIVVSDTLRDRAHILNPFTGEKIGHFNTGSYAHGNDFSHDGKYIYNGSIGSILLSYFFNIFKGDRLLTIANAHTFEIEKVISFDWGLRPSAFTYDNSKMYAQFSYQRGFAEVDLVSREILSTYHLPASEYGLQNYRRFDDYPNNSAHHGLALSGDETKLCLAGTIDHYIAIVNLETRQTENIINGTELPYWASLGHRGKRCYISNSEGNSISVINFETAEEIARIQVGQFPQRSRAVQVQSGVLSTQFNWRTD